MPRRRWLLVIATAAVVAALAGVVALDRSAAADWDTDCASPTQVYNETNPPPEQLNLTSAAIVLFESGTFGPFVNSQGGTICVAGPANFNPPVPPYVGPSGGTLPSTGR